MLRDAQLSIDRTIWPAIPPGLAVFSTVVAFNIFGDGLQGAFAREARRGRIGVGDVQRREQGRSITKVWPFRRPANRPLRIRC